MDIWMGFLRYTVLAIYRPSRYLCSQILKYVFGTDIRENTYWYRHLCLYRETHVMNMKYTPIYHIICILCIHIYIYIYLGTPKGQNFSLKRKNRLLGSQAEISVWGWFQAIFWYSGWFCLNLNLNLERNKAQSRKEVKNCLITPMLTVSFFCPVELGQTII